MTRTNIITFPGNPHPIFRRSVSATVIMDKMTNRSKGFGFVEMSSDDEAQKAIDMWNGKELDGRALTVNEARPMEPRAPRSNGGGGRDRW